MLLLALFKILKKFTMKPIFLAILLSSFYFLSGQVTNYTVTYKFYHILNTDNIGLVHEELMALTFNKSASKYYSETKVIQEEEWQKKYDDAEKKGANNGIYNVDLGQIKKTTNENIFLFPKNKKSFMVKSFKRTDYAIVSQLPDFQWNIEKQTKSIKGYNCQLATGNWKGRTYHAWFTTDLPYSFGPWKLNGLPGIILEAADATNTIRFDCVNINKDQSIVISIPKDAILTSEREFDRMLESMQGVNNQLNSDANGSNTVIESVSPVSKKIVKTESNSFNNPIEINDK